MKKYKVWCKNKKEWERNNVALLPNGDLYDLDNKITVLRKTHDVLFNTGLEDTNNKGIYQEDIVRRNYYNGYCYLRIRQFHLKTIAEFLPELPHEYVIGLKSWGDIDYYELRELENYDLTIVGNTKEDPELLGGKTEQFKFIDKVLDEGRDEDEDN